MRVGEVMDKKLFREKNVKRVSSPDELNDYMRVTSPSVWVILISVIVLIAGFLYWGITGTVTVVNDDGSTQEVSPITFIIN